MQALEAILNQLSQIIWGPVMLAPLLGVGVYLTVGLKYMTWRRIGEGLRNIRERGAAESVFSVEK